MPVEIQLGGVTHHQPLQPARLRVQDGRLISLRSICSQSGKGKGGGIDPGPR
jgi:hypothetical protein